MEFLVQIFEVLYYFFYCAVAYIYFKTISDFNDVFNQNKSIAVEACNVTKNLEYATFKILKFSLSQIYLTLEMFVLSNSVLGRITIHGSWIADTLVNLIHGSWIGDPFFYFTDRGSWIGNPFFYFTDRGSWIGDPFFIFTDRGSSIHFYFYGSDRFKWIVDHDPAQHCLERLI